MIPKALFNKVSITKNNACNPANGTHLVNFFLKTTDMNKENTNELTKIKLKDRVGKLTARNKKNKASPRPNTSKSDFCNE